MIAVDSSVLIDLLGDDVRAAGAEECVRQALARGPVVVCDVVVAEVVAGLGYGAELLDVLEDAGIRFSPSEARSAVRDALGLTKGTQLKVELSGSSIILRKNVDDALSRLRGRFKLPPGVSTDDIMRELRGRAPGDPVDP